MNQKQNNAPHTPQSIAGKVMPGGKPADAVSVKDFTKMMQDAEKQAEQFAQQANQYYRSLHPEDELKTGGVFDKKDFLDHGKVFIPKEAQELFDEIEEIKVKKLSTPAETKEEKSAEQLQTEMNVKLNPEKVQRNEVLSKLKNAFGIREDDKATISTEINGIVFTFEYPTSLTSNFAFAIAHGEGVGALDFSHTLELSQVALSIIALDNIPINDVWDIRPGAYAINEIPSHIRKLCAIKTISFLNSMADKQLEMITAFYKAQVGFIEDVTLDTDNFVEMRCPECLATRIYILNKDKTIPVRYCERDGKAMAPVATTGTDTDAPLE